MSTQIRRCPWAEGDPLMQAYHDNEWGNIVTDDNVLFEFLVLESAQAGLSWKIILHRRENYRNAFAGFNAEKVAQFTDEDVQRLLADQGIIRNRAKIKASINNARCFLQVQKEFGSFFNYSWSFIKNKQIVHKIQALADYPQSISEAELFAKDMKKRGFKFLGAITLYAHMQACGMVNDHIAYCFKRNST